MSYINYVVYNPDGSIVKTGSCFDTDIDGQKEGSEKVIDTPINVDDSTHYVDTSASPHVITQKQDPGVSQDKTSIAADGVEEVAFTNIPTDAKTVLRDSLGKQEITHDGSLEITTEVIGKHVLEVSGIPYLTTEYEFEAT